MSIDQQIAAMANIWPSFEVTRIDDRSAYWVGELRPIMRAYQVRIDYRVPAVIEMPSINHQPRVKVLDPLLRRRRNAPHIPIPHVYVDDTDSPPLCLFDFEAREWTPWCALAETTVPWTIDWLVCYEGWQATGEWTGGGRHPTPTLKPEPIP